jgi:hypothetical protein
MSSNSPSLACHELRRGRRVEAQARGFGEGLFASVVTPASDGPLPGNSQARSRPSRRGSSQILVPKFVHPAERRCSRYAVKGNRITTIDQPRSGDSIKPGARERASSE